MQAILATTFPIFAAIAIGYGLTRAGVFSSGDVRVLGRYVMNVAFPALVLHAVASRDIADLLHPGYLAVMVLAGLASFAIAYTLAAAAGSGPARRALAGMGAALPNSAYVGYPLLLVLLPDRAGQVLALNFLVESFLLIPLSLVLLETARPNRPHSLARTISGALGAVLRMPFVIALLAGLAISLLGLPYPQPLGRLATILGASASAVALVVIGGALAGLPLKGERGLGAAIAAAKLLLHPALAALAVAALPALGLAPLPADLRLAAILSAALPMVAIYVVLAQPYGHEGIASVALLIATVASFVTLSLILAALV